MTERRQWSVPQVMPEEKEHKSPIENATPASAPPRLQHVWRALRSRNYRLFFAGQSISLVGTLMQQVAMSWLVYRLTGSALLLGVLGFASQIPHLVLAPVAGVLADRWDRRRAILLTQLLALVQAGVLAFFVLTDRIAPWQLIALSSLAGVVNAFDIPLRQAYLVELVNDRDDLGNAIALNSTMYNGARLLGPAVAGILVARLGEGICFLVNAASFSAVILAVAATRSGWRPPLAKKRPLAVELREGLRYAFGFPPIRSILKLAAVVGLMGMPYAVLLPLFAKDVLHGGAETFGFLMTAVGVGSLACTLYLASRRSVIGLGRVAGGAAAVFGVGLFGFALSRDIGFSLGCLALAGAGAMAHSAASSTILQTIVEDDKRGRVMSLFSMLYSGTTPIGNLMAGAAAGSIGAPGALIVGGCATCVGAVLFVRRLPSLCDGVRPIYRRMGILPELAVVPFPVGERSLAREPSPESEPVKPEPLPAGGASGGKGSGWEAELVQRGS